ncbi:hypothetical protein HY408_00775 [Candidatus Gottesmanbacteria bacterium]|nr:hypothetical protein [Candidatus Gottesmanbacteria bacterium]
MSCTSKVITFDSDGYKLTGFHSYPITKTLLPGVLFIHGGGKYTNNLYESWQEYLCLHGYASLSFFSRGVGNSEGSFEKGSLSHRLTDTLTAYNAYITSGIVDPDRIGIYWEYDLVIPDEIKGLFRDSIRTGKFRLIKNGTHKLLRPMNQPELKARAELYSSTVHFLNRYL